MPEIGVLWLRARESIGVLNLVIAVLFLSGTPAGAENLREEFAAHDPASQVRVDQSAWQAFLDRYLVREMDGINRVRYRAVTSEDRAALRSHLEAMSRVNPDDLNRDEQFAYWANLYNALTVDLILAHYPVRSIRDIERFNLFSLWPWDDVLITVKGRGLTLNAIEDEILRTIWNDERVHYVVNCASVGCPHLGSRALSSDALDEQLDAAARAFVNHSRGVSIRDDRLVLSKLYKWNRKDFGGSDADVILHLGKYATDDLAEKLAKFDRIGRYQYDWSLNETAATPRAQ